MADEERRLLVNSERCIGCRACATVCAEGLITLRDTDHRRTISFAAVCSGDCDRCVEACPTEAISLTPAAPVKEEGTELVFDL